MGEQGDRGEPGPYNREWKKKEDVVPVKGPQGPKGYRGDLGERGRKGELGDRGLIVCKFPIDK